jgi:uncharacterized protein (TIGR02996 family)
MTHEDVFLQDILAHPDDDTPRLIFADWLDDHADSDRAEFIRLQVRQPGSPRAEQLLREHDEEWAGPVISSLACGWVFRRGFVHTVTAEAGALVGRCKELFEAAPVRCLRLLEPRDHLPELIAEHGLMHLHSLDLGAGRIGDRGLTLLSMCRFLKPLKELHLRKNDIGPEGIEALVSSPYLGNLRGLDLSWNRLGAAGGELLAHWPALDRLDHLAVFRNDPACFSMALRKRLGRRCVCYG